MVQPTTLILGLGREIGEAVARCFFDAGHNIMAADPSMDRVEQARADLDEKIAFFHGDLDTLRELQNCMTRAVEAFGRIDNIVSIPALGETDSLTDIRTKSFSTAVGRTAAGAALTLRTFAERRAALAEEEVARAEQVRHAGTVTFILSTLAEAGQPGHFTQSVSQASVIAVMRAASVELGGSGLRTNAIVAIRPRAAETEDWLKTRTPLGRAALGDEIAEAALYLASPASAIISGETLRLDGGRACLDGVTTV